MSEVFHAMSDCVYMYGNAYHETVLLYVCVKSQKSGQLLLCMCMCVYVHAHVWVCTCMRACRMLSLSLCVCVCMSECMHVCVCYCCYYLFLAIVVIYLSTILYIICVMLNYFTFNLNAFHLHVALMVCFKVNFLSRIVKYVLS